MNFLTKKHLPRRTMLRGLGASIALPLLDSMLPAQTPLAKSAANSRSRLSCIYVPHGATMDKWTPAKQGSDFELTEILRPLDKFRDKISIVSNLGHANAAGVGSDAGADHARSAAVYLSGAHPEKDAIKVGTTIDQIAAARIGQDTPLPSIELSVEEVAISCGAGYACAYSNTISWKTPTIPLPMENNPQVVFEKLFGDGSTNADRLARKRTSRSLLDSVLQQVNSLQADLPADDRAKLSSYLDDVREIERRIEKAEKQTPAGMKLPEAPVGVPESFDEHFKIMYDLQVLAFRAEITRIATLMYARDTSGAVYGVAFTGSPLYGGGSGAGNASNPFGPNSNPSQPSMILSGPIPFTAQQIVWPNLLADQFPKISPGQPPVGAGPPSVIDQNAGVPARNLQWSFGLQREIARNLVVEVGYVGTRGVWWAPAGGSGNIAAKLVNYNYLSPQLLTTYGLSLNNPADLATLSAQVGSAAAGRFQNKIPFSGFPLTATVAQSLLPFPQFNSGLAPTWSPLGDTWYNSLQVKATKRLSHGLDVIYNFTWAKEMDTLGGTFLPTDVGNRQTARTLSTLDRPLVTSFAVNYTTPSLKGSTSQGMKALSWIARDWQVGGFFQYASGALIPPPVANASPTLLTTVFQSTVQDRVPGVPLFTHDLDCHCFDPSRVFVLNPAAWTNPAPGQFGTATYYNDYRNQRRPSENLAIGRRFPIREKASLNLRIEFTNIFNRTEPNDPTATNPQQTQTVNPATGQTTAGFGYISTLGTTFGPPRQGQLVARFQF